MRNLILRGSESTSFLPAPVVALSCNGLRTLIIVAIATLLPCYTATDREAGVQGEPIQFACTLIERFRVVQSPAPAKISVMTPDFDRVRIKLKRIRPKKYVFKGAIIGPNPR